MRKLHFSIWDKSEYFRKYKKDERYSILIVYGEIKFKFSNRQKAERFVKQFEKVVIESFQFYGSQVPTLSGSYFLLLPQLSYFASRDVRESLKYSLDIVDKVFNSFSRYDASAVVHWSMLMYEELVKCCDILLEGARKSRYNQSELIKIRHVKSILLSHEASFFDRYKHYQYRGSNIEPDCKVIQLYDKLQYALNF